MCPLQEDGSFEHWFNMLEGKPYGNICFSCGRGLESFPMKDFEQAIKQVKSTPASGKHADVGKINRAPLTDLSFLIVSCDSLVSFFG